MKQINYILGASNNYQCFKISLFLPNFCTHPPTPNFNLENIDLTDPRLGMQQGVLPAPVAAIFKTVPNN